MKGTLGHWPSVSLFNARKLADAARLQVASGIDPQDAKRKAKRDRLSFLEAWENFDALHVCDLKPKTAKEYRRSAAVDILPRFKSIALKDVKKADVVALIDRIRRRAPIILRWGFRARRKKYPETAYQAFLRCKQYLRPLLSFQMETSYW